MEKFAFAAHHNMAPEITPRLPTIAQQTKPHVVLMGPRSWSHDACELIDSLQQRGATTSAFYEEERPLAEVLGDAEWVIIAVDEHRGAHERFVRGVETEAPRAKIALLCLGSLGPVLLRHGSWIHDSKRIDLLIVRTFHDHAGTHVNRMSTATMVALDLSKCSPDIARAMFRKS